MAMVVSQLVPQMSKTWEFPLGIQPLFKGDNPNFRSLQRLGNVNCRFARSNF